MAEMTTSPDGLAWLIDGGSEAIVDSKEFASLIANSLRNPNDPGDWRSLESAVESAFEQMQHTKARWHLAGRCLHYRSLSEGGQRERLQKRPASLLGSPRRQCDRWLFSIGCVDRRKRG